MLVIHNEGMRMPPCAVQMRVIERKVVVGVFQGLAVFPRP